MSVAPAALDKATLGLHPLDQYEPLIGAATAERIFKKADRVRGAHVIHVNSTFYLRWRRYRNPDAAHLDDEYHRD